MSVVKLGVAFATIDVTILPCSHKEMQMEQFPETTERMIAQWHGIVAPNDPARRMVASLIETIRTFEAQRGTLRFEDEPSSFESALLETREA